MEAYSAKRPYLERVLSHLKSNFSILPYKAGFTILDLIKEDNSQPQVVLRCYSTSAASIVTDLRQPPANVAVQIVLWNSGCYFSGNLVNALGLGLKIDPRFFEALDCKRKRHLDPKHVTINEAVATVIRRYNPDKLDTAPIVLIAGMEWASELATYVDEEIGDVLPFQCPAVEGYPLHTSRYVPPLSGQGLERLDNEHTAYARLLSWCLKKDEEPAVGVTNLCLQPLIPLFYLKVFRIRKFCARIRQEYYDLLEGMMTEAEKEDFISGLPKHRFRLRALVEDSKDALDQFLRYTLSQKAGDLLSTKSWLEAEADLKRTHQEAARLEAQIRDYLQLQVGELALQESKKSIELSNRQIEEGKRGQS